MVVTHICFGRSPLKPVTQACLWGMQWLKHQLTNPHECTVTSECFQQIFLSFPPQQPGELKAGGAHWETPRSIYWKKYRSMITTKTAVGTNIIGARLNFICFKTCFLHQRNQAATIKVVLVWNIPHTELHMPLAMPCWGFYKWNKQLTDGCTDTFSFLLKLFPRLLLNLSLMTQSTLFVSRFHILRFSQL